MKLRARALELLVFTVGAGTLGAEMAAARLLAPWFGDSTIVWANTIATVLVALAIGYSVGGKLADRNPNPSGLARIVLLAAALLAAVPFIADPFLPLAVKAVDQLSVATFAGSLVGVGVLLAIPLFLLGIVSPYAVRLSVDSVEDAGHAAGRLYAISTVGSLVGTFAASLFLIPVVGTRRTFLIFALCMAVCAIPHLMKRRLPAAVVPVAILALIALPTGSIKTLTSNGGEVIWEKETEYQYARVVEYDDGTRYLELNEGHAVHSVYTEGEYLTGAYWDEMLSLSYAGAQAPKSVAILGSAAGTTARQFGHFAPDTRVDAVEIDEDVTKVGQELFDLKDQPNLHLHTADARPWLQKQTRKYDAIMVDAYHQPYIPFYLTTKEFFALAKDHLNPGGVLVVNSAHPEGSTALEKVLTATLRTSFGDAVWRSDSGATNTHLVATVDPEADPAASLAATAEDQPSDLAGALNSSAARLEPALQGGTVYTDDVAPVEWLTDLSLLEVA
ncbi:spermidine synthase [Nocardioides luteus]|uniref:Spermidine synthase n=1 Tax=Nocardioides luteus TaxID=1844 RepID=A0ABQ5ST20_9ACTN|nr:fused MFS/spermidine synthase [Nocardioides luteus]MDR7313281.1 spermidine synthase [Nocardioides luteus]GGR42820.1 spermidine synthase [Nocardioides luteus]GLJ66346.1 spermidine synthase [Nocardioides luteus]